MPKPWLRQLFRKKFLGSSTGPITRASYVFGFEEMESRIVPATRVWTGGSVPLPTAAAGYTGWSDPFNWDTGVPQPGDDVVFPAGLDAAHKPPSSLLNNIFVFPNPTGTPGYPEEANSTLDANFTINNLIILDDNYHIDAAFGQNFTLTILGSVIANIADPVSSLQGVSLIGTKVGPSRLSINLTNETQAFDATGPGLLYITAAIGETGALPNGGGILKTGTGTIGLAGNNPFTGGITVNQGTLLAASSNALGSTVRPTVVNSGATLAVVGPTTVNESIVITGDGVDTSGDGQGDGAIQTYRNPYNVFTQDAAGGLGSPGMGQPAIIGGITLNPSASVGVSGGNTLSISTTAISGAGNLTKLGGGTLRLLSANTYAGQTLVRQGTLQVFNNLALSTSVGDADSTTVFNGAMLETVGALTINERLYLTGGGIPDSVGREQGALHQRDVNTTTMTGIVTLQGAATSIGAVLTPTGSPTTSQITLAGELRGSVVFSKVDAGNVRIARANPNFTGNVFVRNGTLQVADPQALGPNTGAGGGSVTVASTTGAADAASGTLQIEGTYSFVKSLTLNGTGFQSGGALHIVVPVSGTTDITLPLGLALGSATSMTVDGTTSLDVTGVIQGADSLASMTKDGTGTLFLHGNNTYTGATVFRQGRNVIYTSTALGAANSGDTTVLAGATLELNNSLSVIGERLNIAGQGFNNAGALVVNAGTSVWSGAVQLTGIQATRADFTVNAGGSLEFSNVISGDADIHKLGVGALRFTGTAANTYTTRTFVDLGDLFLGKTAGLNAVGGQVTVGDAAGAGNNSARLILLASNQIPEVVSAVPITVTVNETGLFNLNGFNETIGSTGAQAFLLTGGEVQTGTGVLTLGAGVTTVASAETSILDGSIALGGADRTFTVADGVAPVDLQVGVVSGSVGFTKAGAGLMQMAGVSTYTGATLVTTGTLQLGASNVLPDVTDVTVSAGATLDANGLTDTIGSLAGSGDLVLGTGTLAAGANNTSTGFAGVITSAAGGGLTKVGTGTLTLTGISPGYLGTTRVGGGTLLVNADQSAAAVVVQNGGTLGGTGTVGTVTVNAGGQLSPGTSPGILSGLGNLTLNAGSTFVVEVNGATAGNGANNYDQYSATGSATINGATLSFNLGYVPSVGESFNIISSPGGAIGTFAGLPDLATFVQNNRVLQIDYTSTGVTVNVLAFVATPAVTSSNNPALPNTPITFTFTLTPALGTDPRPTGLVQFLDNGTPIGAPVALAGGATGPGTATLTVDGSLIPFLTNGAHTITAQYVGDANYQTVSPTLTQLVTVPSVTTLTAQQGPIVFGDNASFLAAVAQQSGLPVPTGAVTFTAGGVVLGTVALDGTGRAVLSSTAVPPGTVTVTATYSGDSFYRASVATATQVVDRQNRVVVGSDAGPVATVQVFDSRGGALLRTINPFDQYTLGVKVATGDVTGDGVADIVVSAGAGAPGGHVKVIDGVTFNEIASFFTFIGFNGGVNVAVGDVDGDGFGDVVIGTAVANDHVKAFSGRTLLSGQGIAADGTADPSTIQSFFAYSPSGGNTVGVTVGTGDVDGDGRVDIITGSATFAGHVKVFSGAGNGALIGSYFAYGAGYLGGINVAGGDLDGDGRAEVITGATNAPHVKALRLDGSEVASFFAFLNGDGSTPPFGARVGAVDRNGDRLADILVGAGSGAPAVKVFSGLNPSQLIESFIATPPGQAPSSSGVFVGGSGPK